MHPSNREIWTVLHGMLFGGAFLLAFAGGLAGLYSLRTEWVTAAGIKQRLVRLKIGMWSMAAIAWGTVVSGTFAVYPWYRATPPKGTADMASYPRLLLLANSARAAWHNARALNWWNPAGALVGKALTGVIVFLLSWVLFHLALRNKIVHFVLVATIALVLLAVGLVGTFPPFFDLVVAK